MMTLFPVFLYFGRLKRILSYRGGGPKFLGARSRGGTILAGSGPKNFARCARSSNTGP